jgi:hypothetical protein
MPGANLSLWDQIAQGPYFFSNTSITIGAGLHTFTLNLSDIGDGSLAIRGIDPGDEVRIINSLTGAYMYCTVTSVSGATLNVAAYATSGSGTSTSWIIVHIPSSVMFKPSSVATNSSFFPVFAGSNNATPASTRVHTDAGISYNPSTNQLDVQIVDARVEYAVAANFAPASADADFTVDAALYNQALINFTGTTTARTILISNLTQGRHLHLWVNKTDANTKAFSVSVSTTAAGHSTANILVSKKGAAIGAVRSNGATIATLAASGGMVYMFISNISGSMPAYGIAE